MFKIRDPLGLVERDPQLRARNRRYENIVKPLCLALIIGPLLFISVVVLYETIKHG